MQRTIVDHTQTNVHEKSYEKKSCDTCIKSDVCARKEARLRLDEEIAQLQKNELYETFSIQSECKAFVSQKQYRNSNSLPIL